MVSVTNQPGSPGCSSAAASSDHAAPAAEAVADAGEVPPSTGSFALLTWLLAPVIALAIVVVPLATVLSSRQDAGRPMAPGRDGPQQVGGLPGAGAGESGGGDPRRQPQ